MGEIYDYNIAAGSNNLAPPNGFPENMDYRDVNDAARELMAVQARYLKAVNGSVTSTGTQPAYAITVAQTLGAYAAGQIFTFIAHADSTGSCTLNVNALGAGALVDSRGVQLGAADIRNGGIYKVIRTAAGNFRVIGHMSAASLQALVVNTFASAFTTTGTQPNYVITTGAGLLAYATGQLFAFIAHATSTGPVTLNVDSLGAGNVVDSQGNQLGSGDVLINGLHFVTRRGTVFQVVGEVIDLSTQASGILPTANGGTGQSALNATVASTLAQVGAGFGARANLASAATCDLGTVPSHSITITGSVTITSFGSSASVNTPTYNLLFAADVIITAGANIITPGGQNLLARGGDNALLQYEGAGVWRIVGYTPFNIQPTVQRFTSGSGTYTPNANTRYIEVEMVGGGGGGGASGTGNGGNGTLSSFGTWTANPGNGGLAAASTPGIGGSGGTNGTGTLKDRKDGQTGGFGSGVSAQPFSGPGGNSSYGGAGWLGFAINTAGIAAKANTGSGGCGGSPASGNGGSGGGGGETVRFIMTAAQIGASLAYAVGPGGSGGSTTGAAGGAGAAGYIQVTEYPY